MEELTSAQIGARGEQAAVAWLRERGYMIVSLNWRSGRYEIDIVATRLGVLHFVEVKSRISSGYTTPEQSITSVKREAMIRAARIYCAQYNNCEEIQFDLIAVEEQCDGALTIRMVEDVIELSW